MIYSENASYLHSIFLAKIPKKVIAITHMRKSLIKGIEYTANQAIKVSNGAKIRNRYNQVPHLTQDTNGKVTNSQKTPQTRAKR